MKKKYCCDANRELYEDYYLNQSGSGLPVFVGSRGQRGHGLGSMLSGLFRSAMPLIKRGLASFGRHALKTGLEIANDVADGNSFGSSVKTRVPVGIKRFASQSNLTNQSGSGRKRRRQVSKKKKKVTKIRKHRDIFA